MSCELISGKEISKKVHSKTSAQVAELGEKHSLTPSLAVVLIGEDPASKVYVNAKVKKCQELGIESKKIILDKAATQAEVLALIKELNADKSINGILVQSPPPSQIHEEESSETILPIKDVDCFHAQNGGKMLRGDTDGFFPCTPYGIMTLLKESGVDASGKHAVILGRSNIVGKPMMSLLMQKQDGANATVTVCHSRTPNIAQFAKQADILIAAIGKPEFVTADMVKDGAVVIDVGINRVDDATRKNGYRLVGDVAFEEVSKVASKITPVPGGVGPMTIAMLLQNTVKACKLQAGIQ